MLYIGLGYIGVGWGAGLCLFGAAMGISKLASASLEGTARQPEAAGALRISMLIPAALIEGLGFFALIVCLIGMNNLSPKAEKAAASTEKPAVTETAH